ncbi:cholinesterase 1-like isoform X1 [Schistocerca americana]|uniref:cholinesterase 1-like isoform X1 n=1 Tax=Schistocerca americana TaxID=7009 RepID=UPI001F4F6DE8|nr:cholinesterase 1-like isoform X1 [Schistocerca americana]
MIGYAAVFGLLTALCVYAQDSRVTISLSPESALIGLNTTTVRGIPYYSFRGIPYAVPPVGQLRYKDPVPYTWNGSVEAVADAPKCSQASGGQEDCLYLNVYSRQIPQLDGSTGGAAVMVYIHGGSLTSGSGASSSFGPDFFLEVDDIVFVTMNYRLGALGFLSTEDDVIRGNYGFKDQNLALRWVRGNIAAFGGDAGRVTLFGESAGSVSTSYHLLSPLSAGLFQQAIMQSGSALSPRGMAFTARDRAFRLARSLGYQGGDDSAELLDFLAAADAADLVSDDSRALSDQDKLRFDTFVFLPVVEQPYEGAFLNETPYTILAEARANRVPLIAGDTSAECLATVLGKNIFGSNESMAAFDAGFVDSISLDIRVGDEQYRREAAQKIRSFYFGDEPIDSEDFYPLVALISDLYYIEPVDMVVRTWVNQSSEIPVYEYQFDYKDENSVLGWYEGVSHGMELGLIFYQPYGNPNLNKTSDEDITRTNMINMWTNFAKTGNPTPTPVGGVTWQPYNSDAERNYLVIDAPMAAARDVYGSRMDFMHSLLPLTWP